MSLLDPSHFGAAPTTGPLIDRYGRRHTYLRVSVTDRCNYRCSYCMPERTMKWLPRTQLLDFSEIERVVSIFVAMGIERVRITGGEPTLRRDLPVLIGQLARLPGLRDLAMTTNGQNFAEYAQALTEAGLKRVNISLDTLDAVQFKTLTRGGDLHKVLASVDAAIDCGLLPLKINCVVVKGENENQIETMINAFAAKDAPIHLRFIEYMPFDGKGHQHTAGATLLERINKRHSLIKLPDDKGGGPARTWKAEGTRLQVGFISPMTEHFCEQCNRLRLMADGHLRTCLSKEPLPSLRDLMRSGCTDSELEQELRGRIWSKVAGHRAHLQSGEETFEGTMTHIGG